MEKDKIRKEFNEFIDTASEQTLRDFVNFMKERRRTNAEIDSKINNIIIPGEEDKN